MRSIFSLMCSRMMSIGVGAGGAGDVALMMLDIDSSDTKLEIAAAVDDGTGGVLILENGVGLKKH